MGSDRSGADDVFPMTHVLDTLLALTPSGVVFVDTEGIIRSANQNFCEQLFLNADYILGKNLFEVLPPPLAAEYGLQQALEKVSQTGQSVKLADIRHRVKPHYIKTLNVAIHRTQGSGAAAGIMMIWDDISDRVEKIFELSMLRQINEAMMEKNLRLDRLLHMILSCVTAGSALAFNRAFLLLTSKDGKRVRGKMAVGPQSREDAWRIWSSLGSDGLALKEFLEELDYQPHPKESPLAQTVARLNFSMAQTQNVVVAAILNKKARRVTHAAGDPRIEKEFLANYGAAEFVVVPLMGRERVIGAIIADNAITSEPIVEEQVQLLTMFANQAGLAIEMAETYRRLQQDRNQLKQAYQTLKNTQYQLMNAEKLAAVGKMAAMVSHEIRNPLVTIGGFARNILKKKPSGDVRQAAEIIVSEVTRLEKILGEVLDFSRPVIPQYQLCSINEVVQEICVLIAAEIKTRGIECVQTLDCALPQIRVDAQQLKQVILNVVKNSIAAMPGGGRLLVETRRQDEFAKIVIVDTGSGVPTAAMGKLFEPFFTTRQEGCGLGLSVARQIVEGHGGTIDIQSEEGKGTRCMICLPLQRQAGAVASEAWEFGSATTAICHPDPEQREGEGSCCCEDPSLRSG